MVHTYRPDVSLACPADVDEHLKQKDIFPNKFSIFLFKRGKKTEFFF